MERAERGAGTGGTGITERATFAGGCFWGVEAAFRGRAGVVATRAGYTGGTLEAPTYRQVCSGRTGHAEAVEVTFDPARVTYDELLDLFWSVHDPTTVDRQGPDVGSQYRSVIFTHGPEQQAAALASRERATPRFRRPIVTEVVPAAPFYPAEEYHQQYLYKRGLGSCHLR